MPTFRQAFMAALSRCYPLYSGCGTLPNSATFRRFTGESSDMVWCRVPGGEVLGSLDDYVGRAVFYVGDLDRKVTWICKRIVQPGDVVLDIGANIGLVTVWLSRLVGPTGRVLAFEPNPVLCERLEEAFRRNGLSNVTLHRVALGAEQSELDLCVPRDNAGAASLIRRTNPARSENVKVPVERLSKIAMDEGLESIRFIKIDVEGFEPEVFLGARELFERVRPDAILFEMNGVQEGPLHEEPSLKILQKYDYDFFSIPRCLVRMRLNRFDPHETAQIEGHDVLAISKGPRFASLAKAVAGR